MKLTALQIKKFQETVYQGVRGATLSRPHMPWRKAITPYKILVSEIMLQQTPVARVVYYFNNWMNLFPNFEALAIASPAQVLKAWQGLGYNNRGLRLHALAKKVVSDYKGVLPKTKEELQLLPGIGPYTAGAIIAFAYSKPTIMIETNIRRVYIHHFFSDEENVSDNELFPYIQQTLDEAHPRTWYWALMDYGAQLPKLVKFNPNTQSKHYTKQSSFAGSMRHMRSMITKFILAQKNSTTSIAAVKKEFGDDHRFTTAYNLLLKDNVIKVIKNNVSI